METMSTHVGGGECRDLSSLLRVCIRRVDSRSRHAFHADRTNAMARKGSATSRIATMKLLAHRYNDMMRLCDNFTGRAVRVIGRFDPIWRYLRSK